MTSRSAITTKNTATERPTETVELLYFEGCPSTDTFLPRLRDLLAGVGMGDMLVLRPVETVGAAERERFLGSPTVRVDGRDIEPGADARTDFGLKCRLYRTETGMSGAPPDAWVLAALKIPVTRRGLAISRSWASERMSGLSSHERAMHRLILRGFAAGIEPTAERLIDWAAAEGLETEPAMKVLADRDLVHRDPGSGAVVAAYPFSGVPTLHRVQLSSGVETFAMCAIDALGIAFMLEQPAVMRSADQRTGQPLKVTVVPGGQSDWMPADAGVVIASSGAGDSAACTCPHTNFVSSVEAGRDWLDRAQGLVGAVISMGEAIATGRDAFAAMLKD